eukprot:TRINITY_DN592_c0_g2_i1.p1 TRINITY_DN592_c0_g2~~TRINITY_DN592_c0_g2_i1.p1  ORF type:complete len:166 (-),score=9.64 TRINITY_DN592_c0_g2_i1:157-654(-)
MSYSRLKDFLITNEDIEILGTIALMTHTVNTLANGVKKRARIGHVTYVFLVSLFCFFLGSTLIATWQNEPVPWLKDGTSAYRAVLTIGVTLGFFHYLWARFSFLRKTELLLVIIIAIKKTILTIETTHTTYNSWLVAIFFGSIVFCLRGLAIDIAIVAWGDKPLE